MLRRIWIGRWLLCVAFLTGIGAGARAGDAIDVWTDELLAAIRDDGTAPPVAVRAMALMYVSVFDAVNAANDAPFRGYVGSHGPVVNADEAAATASAAYRVLSAVFPTRDARLATVLAAALGTIADGTAKTNGIALGEARAAAILAARAGDGASVTTSYLPVAGPGTWVPTPPGFAPALLPQWPDVIPWAIGTGDRFRPAGPPGLDSAQWVAAFNETKSLGAASGSTRSADQTEIALFWADGRYTFTPPGHWLNIANQLANARSLSLLDKVRLLALQSIAMADAAIVAWDAKYAYGNWRPVTAIAAVGAASDGNAETAEDPSWLPLITTPPFPDYISGHSTFSGAAATILARFFGADDIPFSTLADPSSDVAGIVRDFDGFWDAAEEAGRSRIYGGIHWEFSNADGLAAGRNVGNYVFDELFEPVPEPATALMFVLATIALPISGAAARYQRRAP